ncbi:DUF362 domain-containing protein [Alkaliphilus serpentinus]|uniref:DUF362 domain-containing protein n=1 Tax=Alkaliphilus serpentinus TaxID=1482731 RepID=A0A833MB91_9FIRM|nr:DUF362 domain-containing protein [Alkaliphilus serpentinus]KAB3532799.1 DUF362 domain-containing protein [Alkaliphilus serpentinus]
MSKVIIQGCKNYDLENLIEKLNNGMEKLGGWNQFVGPGDIVLLKPNLIGPKSSDSAAITHSEFLRAMVRILKGKGCIVWIGDSSGGAIAGIAPTAQSFKVSGYERVAEEEGAIIKNFDSEGVVEVQPKGKFQEKMYLAKPIFDADVVINLPKLKTHSAGIYTGAVKNVFGCIPGLRKAKYHKMAPNPEDFGEILADIHQASKLHLHIMDGIIAMEGEGPTAGSAYRGGKILISKDPLALDAVAIKMLGIEMEDVPILKASIKRGVGEGSLENITIEGDYTTIPKLENFKLPKRFRSNKRRNYNALIKVIDFFETRPKVNLKKCKDCNLCVESCPVEAIDKATKKIDYPICIECMCCHELCIHQAVDLKKEKFLANLVAGLSQRR